MSEVTKENIETVLTGIVSRGETELYSTPHSELDKYYYFQYDFTRSKEWNLYRFTDLLDLYKRQCRAWEEHHNGTSCVVERVRDTYLMPKIRQFIVDFEK